MKKTQDCNTNSIDYNMNPQTHFRFQDCFPNLSSIEFDSVPSDVDYVTLTVLCYDVYD